MKKIPNHKESLSSHMGRRLRGNEQQTAAALRWLAIVSLSIFLALLVSGLLQHNTTQVLILTIGILPILLSLWFIKQGKISLPSAILAVNLVLFVTWLT